MSRQLPARPSLEHLKNQAKALLDDLARQNPDAQLADALHAIAREYGFASWPKLKAHVESAAASSVPASPFAGQWIADLARSTRNPLVEVQRATLSITVDDDTVTIVDVVVETSGAERRGENTIEVDGREHPTGAATGYSTVGRWLDPRALEVLVKRKGGEVARMTYALSADDTTLTLSAIAAAHNEYPAVEQVSVFVRE